MTTTIRKAGTPSARRYLRAAGIGAATALLVGVPTDVIDTPVFGREVPVRWWEYPVLAVTVALTIAYFAIQGAQTARPPDKRLSAGVVLTVFAVGCPVCNKLVLLAIGTSGALGVWAPLQPVLALVSLTLLGVAVLARWRRRDCTTDTCAVPEQV